jgi:hypothetical protein
MGTKRTLRCLKDGLIVELVYHDKLFVRISGLREKLETSDNLYALIPSCPGIKGLMFEMTILTLTLYLLVR